MKKNYTLTLGLVCSLVLNTYSQWNVQTNKALAAQRSVRNISIANATTAWISFSDGSGTSNPPKSLREFSKTTDGGATWTSRTITSLASGLELNQISGVSDMIAYAAFADTKNGGALISKTVDGGVTWTTSFNTPDPGWANVINFWDAQTGVWTGDPSGSPKAFEIYTTTNGGTNWNKKTAPAPNNAAEYGIPSVSAVNGNHIWFGTTNGRVYHSPDKGNTWTVGSTNAPGTINLTKVVTAIAFQDGNTGFAIVNDTYYKTTNGGATWAVFNSFTGIPYTSSIAYVPGTTNTYYSVGDKSSSTGSSYSQDGGNTWINIDDIQHNAVAFFNSQIGWAGGFAQADGSGTTGGIYKWDGSVGILKNEVNNTVFGLYPNPSKETLTLRVDEKAFDKNLQVNIFDVVGRKVYSTTSTINSGTIELNLTDLHNGTYFIKVDNGNQEYVEKFIILK